MLLPMIYLAVRAFEADAATLFQVVFRARNLVLLSNTLQLVFCVLAIGTAIALPLAWIVVRSDIRYPRLVSILGVLPLAVPGYVMAYALIGLSGYYGFANQFFGIRLPRPEGLFGAALALTLYTFPYLFLNIRSALLDLDPGLEECARSLGRTRWNAFRTIVLPHLLPSLLAGWLVVGLYVLGDFGAVALMRYEVFSYAIFTQYSGAFDRIYAAWLSLMLMGVTVVFVLMEAQLRGKRYARVGKGAARVAVPVPLGRYRPLVWAFIAIVVAISLGLPALVLTYWMSVGGFAIDFSEVWQAFLRTALAAIPAALISTLLALPIVYLTVRFPSPFSSLVERLTYMGYAVPPLAFALSMVFFALSVVPYLYQSLTLLIFAYCMTFLALALGPIRSRMLQIGPRLEEVSRSLGHGPLDSYMATTFPLLRKSMVAATLLVFIMIVKELPITFLLAPTGYTTLSMAVFSRTSEGMMAEAAPYAAMIVVFSSFFVGLILRYEGRR
ncbi:ABC transporter permease subunit [Chelativorans sp. ZYF759]|uniref:ABC transporter permease n=1 Tax=Chelativorans sp. ZYF759 TaxID=2692213 RepID=UPI00145E0548|nr:iron ABC transporter permease [Chelativorans sp. ZYF759]NMG40785.1 ABC transporter permease subunit [Chelativorans sp. ZYF759]